MRRKLRVAVFGVGRIGRRHARTVAHGTPNAELAVIVDAIGESARTTAAELGVARWTTDADAVLTDPKIDAVVIASSTDTHINV